MRPALPTARSASMPSQGSAMLQSHPNPQVSAQPQSDYRDDFLPENFDYYNSELESSYVCPSPISLDNDIERRCWICFGDEFDSEGSWVKPCHCSLVSHEQCLLAWITENQKGQSKKEVYCPQCNELYCLSEPPSLLVDIFVKLDELIQSAVPIIFLTGIGCSILITSTTYGAYSVLTICGEEEGEKLLGSPGPWGWRVWFGLPMIPWTLIFSRCTFLDSFMPLVPLIVAGGDPILLEMPPSPRLVISVLPWARLFYNAAWYSIFGRLERNWREQSNISRGSVLASADEPVINDNIDLDQNWDADPPHNQQADAFDPTAYILTEKKDLARTVVGALLLPVISSATGNLLGQITFVRNRLPSTFLRSILGGCLFIFLKVSV